VHALGARALRRRPPPRTSPCAGAPEPGATAGQLHRSASQAAASPAAAFAARPLPSPRQAAAPRQYSSPYHFDAQRTGSFPARNLGCLHPVEELYSPEAEQPRDGAAAAALEQHPLGWVPQDECELGSTAGRRVDDEALAVESRLPLELFDSPELELVSPEERLAGAAGGRWALGVARPRVPACGLPTRSPEA
jgi:hypothetical protein